MHSRIVWQTIFWFPAFGLAALIIILLQRRLVREFPFFFSYVLVDWVKDVVSFIVYYTVPGNTSSMPYFYTYWMSHSISALFLLFATLELSLMHLFPRFSRISFYRYLFSVAALIAISLGVSAVYGESKLAVLAKAIHLIDILQVLALLFFVGLMQFMGRHWARYEFAIALGLGVNAVSLVFWFVFFLKAGPSELRRVLPSLADFLACLSWLIAFSRPAKPAPPATPISPGVLHQARQWEEALKESLSRKKPAS